MIAVRLKTSKEEKVLKVDARPKKGQKQKVAMMTTAAQETGTGRDKLA